MKRRYEDAESCNEDSFEETLSDPPSRQSDSTKLELENHFIIRFPKELGRVVTRAIIEGNIQEILTIQMNDDMRYGEVRLNNLLLYAKCVDLPTMVESYKTADTVNVYKTADISQLLICHREPHKEREKELDFELDTLDGEKDYDMFDEDKEINNNNNNNNNNNDKNNNNNNNNIDTNNDTNDQKTAATTTTTKEGEEKKEIVPTVDVKFLYPHGLTPPFRHLRKRRLNIALRDKNLDPPENDVVKDVKYLLRIDSEAERVDYEVIGDEDVKTDFDLSDSRGSYDTDTDIDILDEDYEF